MWTPVWSGSCCFASFLIVQTEPDLRNQCLPAFLCGAQAYRLNLFGARYQWIVAGGGGAGWRLGWRFSGCTANSLLMAADGSIQLQIRELSSTKLPGVSGRVRNTFHVVPVKTVSMSAALCCCLLPEPQFHDGAVLFFGARNVRTGCRVQST